MPRYTKIRARVFLLLLFCAKEAAAVYFFEAMQARGTQTPPKSDVRRESASGSTPACSIAIAFISEQSRIGLLRASCRVQGAAVHSLLFPLVSASSVNRQNLEVFNSEVLGARECGMASSEGVRAMT